MCIHACVHVYVCSLVFVGFTCIGLKFCRRARGGGIAMVCTLNNIWNSTGRVLPIWTVDVNDETQNNSYVQLLATLCVFQPLLRNLRQTSTKRFVKQAVVRDFCGAKKALPVMQGVI